MSGFMYFVEGKANVARGDLPALHLAHAFETDPAQRESRAGPGGRGGVVLGVPPVNAQTGAADTTDFGWFPDRQRWARVPGVAGVWIGYLTDRPPGPDELARGEMVGGYRAALEAPAGRGGPQSWLVPLGRVFPEGTKLPCSLALGPDGELVSEPLGRFAAVCRLADRLWDQVRAANGMLAEGEGVEEMTAAEEFRAAVDVLAVNYRVGPAEISALKVLTTANIKTVLYLFVDMPGFLAAGSKKKPPASGDGSSSG